MKSSEKPFEYPGLSTEQCRKFELFARCLQEHNRRYNLTAITETSAIYSRHFADSLAALPAVDKCSRTTSDRVPAGSLADIGSGSGLPGLALAIARPGWMITSMEATNKKVRFQREVVAQLDVPNAVIVQGRAEDLAHEDRYRETFDRVTARAVAALRILVELGAGLLKPGGRLIAWKTDEVYEELRQAAGTLEILRMRLESVVPYSLPGDGDRKSSLNLVILKKCAPVDARFPRSFARIKSTPMG